MSRPTRLIAALVLTAVGAFVPFQPSPAAGADYASIAPIPDDQAAAQLTRGARLLVAVGPDGALHAGARGQAAGPAEPPIKADDPSVRAVLQMLGLQQAKSFAIVGVQNPQCIRICELIGGDYICRKYCN